MSWKEDVQALGQPFQMVVNCVTAHDSVTIKRIDADVRDRANNRIACQATTDMSLAVLTELKPFMEQRLTFKTRMAIEAAINRLLSPEDVPLCRSVLVTLEIPHA